MFLLCGEGRRSEASVERGVVFGLVVLPPGMTAEISVSDTPGVLWLFPQKS